MLSMEAGIGHRGGVRERESRARGSMGEREWDHRKGTTVAKVRIG